MRTVEWGRKEKIGGYYFGKPWLHEGVLSGSIRYKVAVAISTSVPYLPSSTLEKTFSVHPEIQIPDV